MAYRFLLEVPEALAAEASVAVDQTGDAQVILVRDSHGLGFDERFVDLTIAAHTLQVIDSLYDWFDTLGASRPDVRLVLHSGERLALEANDRGAMVAAIRRDQPWVERSIPKVGEHETEAQTTSVVVGTEPVTSEPEATEVERGGPAAGAELDRSRLAPEAVAVAEPTRAVGFRRLNHVAVLVNDLAKAERFYGEFFNMTLVGRLRRGARGAFEAVNGDYRWDEAARTGTPADVSVLENGPVTLALLRAGRGARLERGVIDHLSVAVDATTFVNLKGEALLRPLTVVGSTDTTFTFRDPFGVVWELTVEGSVPAWTT